MRRTVAVSALVVSFLVACASESDPEGSVAAEDELAAAQAGTAYPALVQEREIPAEVLARLKDKARTSELRSEAGQGKGTIAAAAITYGNMLLVGIVAEQSGRRTLKDLRAFTQSASGVSLVRHDSTAAAVSPQKKGAQTLSASAAVAVAGTQNLKPADFERATSVAVLTTYMTIASGKSANAVAPSVAKVAAGSRPVTMYQDNRCSGLDPLGQWALYIPQKLSFDVLSCCQEHDAALACNCDSRVGATVPDNMKFISCVDRQANAAFMKLPWYARLATGIVFGIERALLVDILGSVIINVGTELSGQRGTLCGQDSCVCGGSKPTIAPDPMRCKRGVNPHDCSYADYEYKTICRGKPAACN